MITSDSLTIEVHLDRSACNCETPDIEIGIMFDDEEPQHLVGHIVVASAVDPACRCSERREQPDIVMAFCDQCAFEEVNADG